MAASRAIQCTVSTRSDIWATGYYTGVLTESRGIDAFFPGPYLSYYTLPTPEEVQNAFDMIDEIIEEEGPFDGVIGFSQGSALASSYILNDLRSGRPCNPFKCAIFFNATVPWDLRSPPFHVSEDGSCRMADTNEPMINFDVNEMVPERGGCNGYTGPVSYEAKYLHRYGSPYANSEKAQITIPTLHIVGANDDYLSQSLQVRDLCTMQGRRFLQHRGGHEIPSDRMSSAKVVSEIQSMLQQVLVG